MRQEQDHVFSLSPSALPVNFLGEERGWSYMKVVIWVGSYIKRDDLSLSDSQDRTVCGYECVFVCFRVCSCTQQMHSCAWECAPMSCFSHNLACLSTSHSAHLPFFPSPLISALNMLIGTCETVSETRKLLVHKGISSGIGLHWLKIIIDLLMELSVSAHSATGSGVTDRDGVGWPTANQEEPLCWMGWEDGGRLREG